MGKRCSAGQRRAASAEGYTPGKEGTSRDPASFCMRHLPEARTARSKGAACMKLTLKPFGKYYTTWAYFSCYSLQGNLKCWPTHQQVRPLVPQMDIHYHLGPGRSVQTSLPSNKDSGISYIGRTWNTLSLTYWFFLMNTVQEEMAKCLKCLPSEPTIILHGHRLYLIT